MMRWLTGMLLILAALFGAGTLQAVEKIHDYYADIAIQEDGTILVTETIAVTAEGKMIRRGIYRDFPTDYKDRLGNRYRTGFEVLEVQRDGDAESWHTEDRANGVRLYIGSADRLVSQGLHEYRIKYRTHRQVGFFDDHDELYWNVTGNGWDFAIDRASALIRLPQAVAADNLRGTGYTGRQGSTESALSVTLNDDGSARFVAERPLGAREGLTAVISFPKGLVEEPGVLQRTIWLLKDNRGLMIGLIGIALLLLFYYRMWQKVGRDPAKGVIIPEFRPPNDLSPAAVRYLHKQGFDNEVFTAAVLSLAQKGYLGVEQTGRKKYRLLKYATPDDGPILAPGEASLLKALFKNDHIIELTNENHRPVREARSLLEKSLAGRFKGSHFNTNGGVLLVGILFSISVFTLLWMTNVGLFHVVIFAVLALVTHGIFAWLIPAPTVPGRKVMDAIEGFQMYLETAEKEELNLKHPPEITPQLFDAYLPYAFALGVDQEWSEQFDRATRTRDPDADGYRPTWFHSSTGSRMSTSGLTSAVGAGLSSAIASASTPPGSSSGSSSSGGGSSGGGGGGGGGGGW